MKIDLYHSIRWSRYKAKVFSALYLLSETEKVQMRITQIADTSGERVALSGVALEYHKYPHTLLFPGAYDSVPKRTLIATLFRRVWRSDADLVLIPGFDLPEYWAMLLAAVLRGMKRATFCDSTLADRPQSAVKGIFKRVFFSLCHGTFCYGLRAKQYLLHYGVPESHIHLRCQAAALPDNYTPASALASRLKHSPSLQSPRFLYVGRLSAEKGLDTLLAAFAKARESLPASRLIIVGGGPLLESLSAEARALGVDDAVEFTGGMCQSDLAEQYAKATCLILPSRREPWGLVVNEALHYGCPVVVSNRCGCVPELVINGVTGFDFTTDDTVELTEKLLKLVREFANAGPVAEHCLDLIGHYTPTLAAAQMLQGCRKVLSE